MSILLVEDDSLIAQPIVRALERQGHSVEWLPRGDAAAMRLAMPAHPFDVVVLDIGLPGRDGLDVLRGLRTRGDPLPVLLLTARDDLADRVLGLDAGADDYLVKPFEMAELEARIRALMRRRGSGPAAVPTVRVGRLALWPAEAGVRLDGRPLDLTPREAGVLAVLLQRAGRVVSKSAVLEEIALADPTALELSDSAVEVIVHRLRRKLEASGVEISTVRGFGYLLRDPDA